MSNISKLIEELCPDGVEFKSLNDLGKFYGGLKSKSKNDFQNGNARYISYKNIYSNIATDLEASDFVSVSSSENQLSLQYGDVLMTGSSENREEVGLSSVVASEPLEKIYLNSFSICYRFNVLEGFNPDFVKYLFRSLEMRKQIEKTANGVTRINVSKKLLGKVKIPLVPLEIQTKIAKILDKFTLLEAELEAELEARRKQYAFYQEKVFSFKGQSDLLLPLLKISDISKKVSAGGDVPSECIKGQELPSESHPYPVYSNGSKGNDLYGYSSTYKVEGPCVTVSARGTIGYHTVRDGKFTPIVRLVTIVPDISKITVEYLNYVLDITEVGSSGGSIPQLTVPKIKDVEIPVPPLEEQQRIVDILDRFDALVNDISSGLPAEIAARRKQYEHYRDQLLTFKELQPAGS